VTSPEKRVERLEQQFAEATEGRPIGPDPDLVAIFDELSLLKSSRAVRYRGGVRLEPENLPEKLLGEDYTREQLLELAIARALEKRGYSTAEIAEGIQLYLRRFEYWDSLRAG
jgi:hypothetical protein